MISEQPGEASVTAIEEWANRIIAPFDTSIQARDSYHDPDSSTYVIRLVKGSRVLLFRLSEAQVHTPGREAECEKTLRKRVGEFRALLR